VRSSTHLLSGTFALSTSRRSSEFCGPFLAPVATLVVFVLVFSKVKDVRSEGIPYPLYAFVGLLCWNFFNTSFGNGGNSLLNNKALLAKTNSRGVLSAGDHGCAVSEHVDRLDPAHSLVHRPSGEPRNWPRCGSPCT